MDDVRLTDWLRRRTAEEARADVERQPHVQAARRELARVRPYIRAELDRVERIAQGGHR